MKIGFIFPDGTELLCGDLKHEEIAQQYLREKGLTLDTDKAEVFMREILGAIQIGAQKIDRIVRFSEKSKLSAIQYDIVRQCREMGYIIDDGKKSMIDTRGRSGVVNPVTKKFVYSRSGD